MTEELDVEKLASTDFDLPSPGLEANKGGRRLVLESVCREGVGYEDWYAWQETEDGDLLHERRIVIRIGIGRPS